MTKHVTSGNNSANCICGFAFDCNQSACARIFNTRIFNTQNTLYFEKQREWRIKMLVISSKQFQLSFVKKLFLQIKCGNNARRCAYFAVCTHRGWCNLRSRAATRIINRFNRRRAKAARGFIDVLSRLIIPDTRASLSLSLSRVGQTSRINSLLPWRKLVSPRLAQA